LANKIKKLKERQATCQSRLDSLEESGEKQFSETDPDARLLKKRGETVAGYNVQIAVDVENKILVCADVVNDTQQLTPMALQAKDALEVDALTVDSGYYEKAQIKECVDAGVTPYVAVPNKEASIREEGRFARSMFTYDTDSYKCPAEQVLVRSGCQKKNGKTNHRYVSDSEACSICESKSECLPRNLC